MHTKKKKLNEQELFRISNWFFALLNALKCKTSMGKKSWYHSLTYKTYAQLSFTFTVVSVTESNCNGIKSSAIH